MSRFDSNLQEFSAKELIYVICIYKTLWSEDEEEYPAILFLWVTAPFARKAFDVVDAWGVIYKSQFIWNKMKHNMGWYTSARHELLYICTKGTKCTPEVRRLFNSVQSIPRTVTHSEKPEDFRQIIDTIYPSGSRIELFARTAPEGWDVWGNDVPQNDLIA